MSIQRTILRRQARHGVHLWEKHVAQFRGGNRRERLVLRAWFPKEFRAAVWAVGKRLRAESIGGAK